MEFEEGSEGEAEQEEEGERQDEGEHEQHAEVDNDQNAEGEQERRQEKAGTEGAVDGGKGEEETPRIQRRRTDGRKRRKLDVQECIPRRGANGHAEKQWSDENLEITSNHPAQLKKLFLKV